MKKILFIVHKSSLGGPSQSLYLNILELKERYKIKVIMPDKGPLYTTLKNLNVEVEIFQARWRYLPYILFKIIYDNIDVIYGNNFSNDSFYYLVASKVTQVPFIWHIREMIYNNINRAQKRLRLSTKIITVSISCKNAIEKFLPKREIEVVYNGVDTKKFMISVDEGKNYLEKKYNIPTNQIKIVTVGTVNQRKNQLEMIECISKLKNDIDFHLLIVGKISNLKYKEKIDAYIESVNLKDKITFTGVSNDISRILSGSDIFLFLSKSDPHPRAILEAMASSLPIIAYKTDGVKESIENNISGFLVKKGNKNEVCEKLFMLLGDNQLRQSIGNSARKHVYDNFKASMTAKRIDNIIRDVFK